MDMARPGEDRVISDSRLAACLKGWVGQAWGKAQPQPHVPVKARARVPHVLHMQTRLPYAHCLLPGCLIHPAVKNSS